jgi:hypothetical protein
MYVSLNFDMLFGCVGDSEQVVGATEDKAKDNFEKYNKKIDISAILNRYARQYYDLKVKYEILMSGVIIYFEK